MSQPTPIYPNPQEILQNPPQLNEDIVKTLIAWKKDIWHQAKRQGDNAKFDAIKGLLIQLADMMGKSPVNVEYRPNLGSCFYQGTTKTIFINQSLSIISALHELGHHLEGSSELKACSLSVHLFKAAFPKAFAKLHWEGHLLKKPA